MSGRLGKTDLIWVAAYTHLVFAAGDTLAKVGDDEDLLSLHLSYFEAILKHATSRRTVLISRQSKFMRIKMAKAFSWIKFVDEGKLVWYNFYVKCPADHIPDDDQGLIDQFQYSMLNK
jgi:hypothetical protein